MGVQHYLDHEDDDRHNDVCMWVGSKHLLIDLLITQSNLSTTHCTTKSFPTSKGVEIVKQIEINPHPSSLNALDQEGVHGSPSTKSCSQYIAIIMKSQLHRTKCCSKLVLHLKDSSYLDVYQLSSGHDVTFAMVPYPGQLGTSRSPWITLERRRNEKKHTFCLVISASDFE